MSDYDYFAELVGISSHYLSKSKAGAINSVFFNVDKNCEKLNGKITLLVQDINSEE